MTDLGTCAFGHHRRRSHAARIAVFLATTAMTSPFLIVSAVAQNLPTGASVAAGKVTIAQPSATQLNITQTSHSAVVNYQGFSVGQGSTVTIAQPDASAAILNRVTGNTPSTIAGQINANGQVYLVNPNGIAITSSGTVNTGGGFVASTLGISDSDFMAGKRSFTGNGASANVSNDGAITVGRGGYAALIGGTVSNSGTISVPLGKVGLGSGEQAALDFSGDGFLQVAVPTKAGGNDALVKNSGSIKADGGSVIISAATAREAARNAVNISGTVQARSISGRNGSITIGGGEGGNVKITGKLDATSRVAKGGKIKVTGRKVKLKGAIVDASGATGGGTIHIGGGRQGRGELQRAESTTIDTATTIKADAGQSGNGGEVVVWSDDLTTFAGNISARGGALSGSGGEAEVSGEAMLAYTGFTDLSAFHGAFGTLLLDPYNIVISDGTNNGANRADVGSTTSFTANAVDSIINAATLETALGGANVTVSTGGVGSPGAQAGNITVAAPVAWSSGALLTLDAANAIAINANITVAGGGQLALNTATTTIGSLTQPLLSFGDGASATFAPSQSGQALSINGNPYTLLYTMADLDGIDGAAAVSGGTVNAQANGLSGRYALAGDLDATGTTYTAAPIGATFSGTLTGLGHSITDLTISAPGTNNIGLVSMSSGTLRDIGLIGGSVSGLAYVGGLVGTNDGAITQAYATASVSESNIGYGGNIGGLVGANNGAIVQAYATGGVTGYDLFVGGLVGFNVGTISQAYVTGAVLSESSYVGGLVGYNGGTISQVYATGAVYGGYSDGDALVGIGGAPMDGYWNTQTSGSLDHGIGIGLTTAQFQSGALPSGFDPAVWGAGAGLYPYLKILNPNGVQAVSGMVYSDLGVTPAASGVALGVLGGVPGLVTVSFDANGRPISQATTGANGYYYFAVAKGALTNGTNLLASALPISFHNVYGLVHASVINAATLATIEGAATPMSMNLYGNALLAATTALTVSGAPSLATLLAAATTAAGTDTAAAAVVAATTFSGYFGNGASFSMDTPTSVASGDTLLIATSPGTPLTVDAAVTVADNGNLGLISGGALGVNAPMTAKGTAGISLAYDPSAVTNLSFAPDAPLTYVAANGDALSSSAGGTLAVNGQNATLIYTMAQLDAIDGLEVIGGSPVAQYGDGMSGLYALADDLDATGTTYIGPLVGNGYNNSVFNGTLMGLAHTVTGLTINAYDYTSFRAAGLVATSTGTLRDIGLLGGTVSGADYVGGLYVGELVGVNAGTIVQAYATGTVSGTGYVGGLVGYNVGYISPGTITQAYATGNASGAGDIGGLVGNNSGGTITQSYATGNVSSFGYRPGFDNNVGGLVGSSDVLGYISQAYATGAVSGSNNVGGLVGGGGNTTTNSYWDMQTSGQPASVGGIGLTTAQFQSGRLPSGFDPTVWATGAGLYPYLKTFFPNGVQAVSGFAYSDAGTTRAGSGLAGNVTVSLASGGAVVGSAGTGANGYYYIALPGGALANRAGILVSTAANGSLSADAASFALSSGSPVAAAGLDLSGGWRREAAGALTTLSGLDAAYAIAAGSTPASALTLANREITAPGDFALDGSVTQSGTLSLAALGAVTQTAGTTVTAGGLLVSGGDATLTQAGNTVGTVAGSGASLALATSGSLSTGTLNRAGGTSLSGVTTTGAVSLSAAATLTLASGAAVTGTSPILSAGGAFVNQAGSAGLAATSGRWLVYSANPGGDTFGGLDSANAAVWNKAAGAAVTPTGNRYVFASQPTLTVTSADRTKTYGDDGTASVVGAYAITGFDPGVVGAYLADTAATALTGTASVTSAGSVVTADVADSPYAITAAAGTLAAASGYGLTFASTGRLTIGKRGITVTADGQSRIYGAANPALTYTVGGRGLVNGDTLSGALATGATGTSSVGDYAITQGSLAASPNYAIAYTGADLSVGARAIAVTADDKNRIYGNTNPALTYTVGGLGLVNGDTLSGALATGATLASAIGDYAITQGTLAASPNYALTYVGADLTVGTRAITVTADGQSRIYGVANPTLTYRLGGLSLGNGDTLSGALATAAMPTSNIGSYAITQGTLAASSNYTLTYAGANLAIVPAINPALLASSIARDNFDWIDLPNDATPLFGMPSVATTLGVGVLYTDPRFDGILVCFGGASASCVAVAL